MRGKVNQLETESTDKYGFVTSNESVEKKLDLNDLLKRAKDQKKNDNRTNLLILSAAGSLIFVVVLLLSL